MNSMSRGILEATQDPRNDIMGRSFSMRPRTANISIHRNSERRIHKSYGRLNQDELTFKDENKIQAIWSAFGLYISKNIKQGRGVAVPKFGQFTFTQVYVDLKGSTNAYIRDNQDRFPVFLIAKDFNCHLPIYAGIASGMTTEMFGPDGQHTNQTNHLRIYGNQGQSGIIPKVKLNYFEVALLTDGRANKDECKQVIDQKIRIYSEHARKGTNVDDEIPNLGRFQIKNGIAGFKFNRMIFDEARGKTVKKYENIFGKNNWMNDRLFEANKTNFGPNAKPIDGFSMSNITLTRNATNWNVGIPSVNNGSPIEKTRQETQNVTEYSEPAKSRKSRPLTAATASRTRVSSNKTYSRYSQASTFLSRVTELAPFEFMNLANTINVHRSAIIGFLQSPKTDKNMRDNLSSSQIQKLLSKVGVNVPIGHMKALLKELGFEWNGKTCSMLQLLQSIKEYINPQRQYTNVQDNSTKCNLVTKLIPPEQEAILDVKRKEGDYTIRDIIKDLFYSSGLTMYQLFKQATPLSQISFPQFKNLVETYSGGIISKQDIQTQFSIASKNQDFMFYKDFEENFSHRLPSASNIQSETLMIKRVREWMFQRQYSTQIAFERLIRCVDRFTEGTLRRVDFHKAFILNKVGMNAPEIDFVFDILANGKDEISFELWGDKIYDDVTNPLQIIREIVHSQNINEDDLLYQMKIKIWDDPLYYKQFETCMLRIDPSFSDGQCRALFAKLKNHEERVEIPKMISNICGTQKDTVDFKNQMIKDLYSDIFQQGNHEKFLQLLENSDHLNDGKVSTEDFSRIILQVTNNKYTEDEVQKFVRQLRKDEKYKIAYNDFIEKVTAVGNKEHNPFRTVMQRMAFFLEQNKISAGSLLKRLAIEGNTISVSKFADFLKQKIDKRRDQNELFLFAQYTDIDKDGQISEEDLLTCLRNINSRAFFNDCSKTLKSSTFNAMKKHFTDSAQQKLSEDKILQICKQIKNSMIEQKMSLNALWKKIDVKEAGLINLSQFTQGLRSIVQLAPPIMEKFFNLMDSNRIGLVDFEKFSKIVNIETSLNIPNPEKQVTDGFEWQEQVIKKIRDWCIASKLGPVESFRSFDRELSGQINMDAMKKSLVLLLNMDKNEMTDTRMNRLFKMMSFYKLDYIQQSDFDRLLADQNPYQTAGTSQTQTKFKESLGGGFQSTSTCDWKFAALQQIGLLISKRFVSQEECFKQIAGSKEKIFFEDFQKFIESSHALNGFNMTLQLMQKLFAELDPHRKAYLNLNDWISSFKLFNQKETMVVEFKNFVQSQFVDAQSVFAFLMQHGSSGQTINFTTFQKAFESIFGTKRTMNYDVKHIFNHFSSNKQYITQEEFEREFAGIHFIGTQYIQIKQSINDREKDIQTSKIKTIKHINTQTSKWEADVLQKVKLMIKHSGKPIDQIFKGLDTNNNGLISSDEFHEALGSFGLGLTENEIHKLMMRVDSNQDGSISYNEFVSKLRDDPAFEVRMKERSQYKLAQIKQQIVNHMTSTRKAFEMFDSTKTETLSFSDFEKMYKQLAQLAGEDIPSYLVVRDVFDAIDFKQDQLIDLQEWNDTFNNLESSDPKLSFKTTPLAIYQNSFEAKQIQQCMHRNRKLLLERFQKYSTHSDHNGEAKYITFDQAKKALEPLIISNFKKMISNAKLDCLLSVAQVPAKIGSFPEIKLYDFMQLI